MSHDGKTLDHVIVAQAANKKDILEKNIGTRSRILILFLPILVLFSAFSSVPSIFLLFNISVYICRTLQMYGPYLSHSPDIWLIFIAQAANKIVTHPTHFDTIFTYLVFFSVFSLAPPIFSIFNLF